MIQYAPLGLTIDINIISNYNIYNIRELIRLAGEIKCGANTTHTNKSYLSQRFNVLPIQRSLEYD